MKPTINVKSFICLFILSISSLSTIAKRSEQFIIASVNPQIETIDDVLHYQLSNLGTKFSQGYISLILEYDNHEVLTAFSNKLTIKDSTIITSDDFRVLKFLNNFDTIFGNKLIAGSYSLSVRFIEQKSNATQAELKHNFKISDYLTYTTKNDSTYFRLFDYTYFDDSNYLLVIKRSYIKKTVNTPFNKKIILYDTTINSQMVYVNPNDSDFALKKVEFKILDRSQKEIYHLKPIVTDKNKKLNFSSPSSTSDTLPLNKIEPPSIVRPASPNKPNITNITSNGSIVSESKYSDFKHPYQTTPASYSRLYFSPTVSVLGLPVNIDVFVSTEANTRYNMNNITFSFDSDQYRKNLRARYNQEYLNELNAQKQKTSNLLQKRNLLELEKLKLENHLIDIDTTGLIDMDTTLNINYHNTDYQLDTLGIADSTDFIKKRRILEKREKIIKLKNNIKQTEQQIEELNKLIALDSFNLQEKSLRDPNDFFENKIQTDTTISGFTRFINSAKTFNFGTVYPYFSKYTIDGLAVRGVDIEFQQNKSSYHIAFGRAVRNDYTFTGFESKPIFDRNYYSAKYSCQLYKTFKISSSIHKIKDTKTNDPFYFPTDNFIYGNELEYTKNKLSLKFEIATSYYVDNYINTFDEEGNKVEYKSILRSFNKINHSPTRTFGINGNYNFNPKSKLSFSSEKRGTYYKTLGSPFLRNDLIEHNLAYEQKAFNDKITSKVFYKTNRDNLEQNKLTTNKLKGYGLSVQSNFKNLPNFTFLYSPFEQGNQIPDTLLRTYNKTSILVATVSYIKRLNKLTSTSLLTYTNSTNEFNNGTLAKVSVLNFNQSMYIASNWEIDISVGKSFTYPKIDTVNYKIFRYNIEYMISPKISVLTDYTINKFNSGALYTDMGAGVNFLLLNTILAQSKFSSIRVKDIWGYNDRHFTAITLTASYYW